jgi:hypothetical protein
MLLLYDKMNTQMEEFVRAKMGKDGSKQAKSNKTGLFGLSVTFWIGCRLRQKAMML